MNDYYDHINPHTGAPLAPSSEDLGVNDHSLERATECAYPWFDASVPFGLVRHVRVPIDEVESPAALTLVGEVIDVQVRVAGRIDSDELHEVIQVFRAEVPFIVFVSTGADSNKTVLTLSVDADGRVEAGVVEAKT